MAITNYDGIIASRAAGKQDDPVFNKTGTIGGVTANWYTFIKAAGSPASFVASTNASAGGELMTSTKVGSIMLNPTTGTDKKYLLTFAGSIPAGAEIGVLGLVDVLWYGPSIQINSSATVTVNSGALTRSTSGKANQLAVVVSTAVGATASTATIWYTDAGDSATSITCVLSSAGTQGRILPAGSWGVPLPNGIKSVQSVQVQTAQGSGAFDLMMYRPLAFIPTITLNTWVERDMTAQIDGILELESPSNTPGYLSIIALTNGSTARGVIGQIRTCAG
jgi:hypothetical protein